MEKFPFNRTIPVRSFTSGIALSLRIVAAKHLIEVVRLLQKWRMPRRARRLLEYYWRKMLSSRSWKGTVYWKKFQQIKDRFPLLPPRLRLPYGVLQALATPL